MSEALRDPMAAADLVIQHEHMFPADFGPWLMDNWGIWLAFSKRADRLWDAGVRHAGARMIGETIRYLTNLRERSSAFKCNDHSWPSLARLYLLARPDRPLFELRGRS